MCSIITKIIIPFHSKRTLLDQDVEKRPTTGELLRDAAVGDYVLEMYESQLDCVSEREVCLRDEEIRRIKGEKNEKVKKVRKKNIKINEMKQETIKGIKEIKKGKEEIRRISKEKEGQKVYNANLRKEVVNLQEEIAELRNKSFPFLFLFVSFLLFLRFSLALLFIVVGSVVDSKIEFIEPLDGVETQETTTTFTEDCSNRSMFINKIIDSGITRMFIFFFVCLIFVCSILLARFYASAQMTVVVLLV
jgi:ABC-type multidrug transport system fused ATPase/permease subunit